MLLMMQLEKWMAGYWTSRDYLCKKQNHQLMEMNEEENPENETEGIQETETENENETETETEIAGTTEELQLEDAFIVERRVTGTFPIVTELNS
jgi:hypothetical protein